MMMMMMMMRIKIFGTFLVLLCIQAKCSKFMIVALEMIRFPSP